MYNNLDYSSLGLGPETYHSPQGQGQEAPLTTVRVTPTFRVTRQQVKSILGVSQLRNPWTDRLRIWHTWLCRWPDHVHQIS